MGAAQTGINAAPGGGGDASLLIFIKPAARHSRASTNINSQLNIYMKEIASPPPQRTCLKLGLLVAVGDGGSPGREQGVGWQWGDPACLGPDQRSPIHPVC